MRRGILLLAVMAAVEFCTDGRDDLRGASGEGGIHGRRGPDALAGMGDALHNGGFLLG